VNVAILFDLDGTLIDSTEAILDSFSFAYGFMGEPVPEPSHIVPMIGIPLREMFLRLGAEERKADRFVDAYRRRYRAVSREKTVLLPGAFEAVKLASGFATLGVVTSKTGLYSKELLEHFGLISHFDVVIGSENVAHHKPHPEPIHKALATMGADAENTWMVGDTLMDVEAAYAAGVKPFALTCGYGCEKALGEACRHIAADPLSAVRRIRSASAPK